MKKFFSFITFMAAVILLASCEKVDLTDIGSSDTEDKKETTNGSFPVTFTVSSIEHISFENTTSRATDISSLCSRLSLAVFQGDSKVKVINQTSADSGFGTFTLNLSPGSYRLVCIAHNGLGNCTISSPERITFENNKCTDTFFKYDTLTVSEASTHPIELSRPVAMFRLKITDPMPSNVVQMQFAYTGGSSTFNAFSGFGCVNSNQKESFSIDSSYYGKPSTFEIYSFPHEANDFLTIKVTAIDSFGQTVKEASYENMYIQPNVITQHSGIFFNDSVSTISSVTITDDGKWSSIFRQ